MSATQRMDSNLGEALVMALELGQRTWKLAFGIGPGGKGRCRTMTGGDVGHLVREIAQARKHFGLPDDAPVLSCYEAGRDGFWLHRCLLEQGVANVVVDSSSIEVNRRRRRAKKIGSTPGGCWPCGFATPRENERSGAWSTRQVSKTRTRGIYTGSCRRSRPTARGTSTGSRACWPPAA